MPRTTATFDFLYMCRRANYNHVRHRFLALNKELYIVYYGYDKLMTQIDVGFSMQNSELMSITHVPEIGTENRYQKAGRPLLVSGASYVQCNFVSNVSGTGFR